MTEDLKARMLKPRIEEADIDVEGVGTLRVRGLTRGEVFQVQQCKTSDASERKILTLAMVDPPLTEGEARAWQENSPAGEIEPVVDRIRELSGLADGADKSGLSTVRDE